MFNTFRSRLAAVAKTVASAFRAKQQAAAPIVTTTHSLPPLRTGSIQYTPGAFGSPQPSGSKLLKRFAKGNAAKARGY